MELNYECECAAVARRPLIITGSGRSGTTIFGTLMHSLRQVEYFFEPPLIVPLFIKFEEMNPRDWLALYSYYVFDALFLQAISGRNLNFNPNDDTYIYKVKSREDIAGRLERSARRAEIVTRADEYTVAYKHPELIFFLDAIREVLPEARIVVIQRNPDDVLSSLLQRKWFSADSMDARSTVQIYPRTIARGVKVPFWVLDADTDFWVAASELDRSAYYLNRVLTCTLGHLERMLVVQFENMVSDPSGTLDLVLDRLALAPGPQTPAVLDSIKARGWNAGDLLSQVCQPLQASIRASCERISSQALNRHPAGRK